MTVRVAVIGAGISGLTAAHRLRRLLGRDAAITIFEASGDIGGKLSTGELAGRPLDLGAEAFLARRPEALTLIAELGLTGDLAYPTSAKASIVADGRLNMLPSGTMMGIPARHEALAGLLSTAGLRAVAGEAAVPLPALPKSDLALGELLRRRFGDELVDRLVDPLVGGVYAGGADGLGLRATLPALAGAVDNGARSLSEAVGRLVPQQVAASGDAPVFGTLTGGLGTLIERLALAADAEIRCGTAVTGLQRCRGSERQHTGWLLTLSATGQHGCSADSDTEFDAVLLAVPAPAARRLLADQVPRAATELAGIGVASMVVIGFAMPSGTDLPDVSGILIGARERRRDGHPFTAKAFTFSSRKWAHHGGRSRPVLLRGSVGRYGDAASLRVDDEELVRLVRCDLANLTGVTARPLEASVTRWGGGLPQYGVGHTERVGAIEKAIGEAPGLEIAGAALHGVGIPACIGTAEAAVRRLVATL